MSVRRYFLVVLLLGACFPLVAHPPVGIVMDRSGVVYYSDLERVWKIEPDGRKTVAVPDAHTHELDLDSGETSTASTSGTRGTRRSNGGTACGGARRMDASRT